MSSSPPLRRSWSKSTWMRLCALVKAQPTLRKARPRQFLLWQAATTWWAPLGALTCPSGRQYHGRKHLRSRPRRQTGGSPVRFFPAARRMAALADARASGPQRLQELEDAAHSRGVTLSIYRVARSEDIGPAIEQAKAPAILRSMCSLPPFCTATAMPYCTDDGIAPSCHLSMAGTSTGGRLARLRPAVFRLSSTVGAANGKSVARSRSGRFAGRATDQVRPGRQPEDCQGNRP